MVYLRVERLANGVEIILSRQGILDRKNDDLSCVILCFVQGAGHDGMILSCQVFLHLLFAWLLPMSN